MLRRVLYNWRVHGLPRCDGWPHCLGIIWPLQQFGGNGETAMHERCAEHYREVCSYLLAYRHDRAACAAARVADDERSGFVEALDLLRDYRVGWVKSGMTAEDAIDHALRMAFGEDEMEKLRNAS